MAGKLWRWLGWGIALMRHSAEMHPGVITFGPAAPPAELPRRPAQGHEHAHSPAPRGAAPRQGSPASQQRHYL
jgi:hypothetical protein